MRKNEDKGERIEGRGGEELDTLEDDSKIIISISKRVGRKKEKKAKEEEETGIERGGERRRERRR